MTAPDNIQIKPVDTATWPDFEKLFESRGGPDYCWCMTWRLTKEESANNNKVNRKKFIKERIDADTPIGLLAYLKDEAIAWCSIAPRDTYQRLDGDEHLKKVWSIACFYIKRPFRKNGLVSLLIDEAGKYAKQHGAAYLEAYPVEPDSPSYRFMGFISTFEKAGFHFVKKAGSRRHVMVKKL